MSFEQEEQVLDKKQTSFEPAAANEMSLLSLKDSKDVAPVVPNTASDSTNSVSASAKGILGNMELIGVNKSSDNSAKTSNPGDHGHWITDRLTPPEYVPSQSESNGFRAAQILSNPGATAAERIKASELILNSPSPEHAVSTANNGYPVTQGVIFGLGAKHTDSLSDHGMKIGLNHVNIEHPANGQPSHANYRPAYTERVPTSITVTAPRQLAQRIQPAIHR